MHDSKVRSRLKAQLTKVSSELGAGLSKPLARFVSQMLFGIQSSQDVKLSNIARSLKEEIALIRTEKRLSRNLKSAELEKELTPQLVKMGSMRVQVNTVLALDLIDICIKNATINAKKRGVRIGGYSPVVSLVTFESGRWSG